ncbi:MAG: hypothetical protein HRU20_15205 [Pseudomonadales bacterium]|nr:hypothetical protein [Pseudomonadales bacterium]
MIKIFLILILSIPAIGYCTTYKVLNFETGEVEYINTSVDLLKYKVLEIIEHKPTNISDSVRKVNSKTSEGYYSSGALRYVYTYVEGKRDGVTKELYESGNHKADYLYKNDLLIDGKGFHDSGELKYQYTYQDGKRHGASYEYDKEGALIGTWLYSKGKLQ